MDENFATNEARFATNLAVIRKEVERSHDDFITEHFRKYNEPELPRIELLDLLTFFFLS